MLPKSFSIRTLLLLTTLLCAVLATWTYRAKKQLRFVAALLSAGARVTYDYQIDADRRPVRKPPRLSWLASRFGDDYFYEVVGVHLYPEPPQEADDLVKLLDDAQSVEFVAIWPGGGKGRSFLPRMADGGLTDNGLEHLLSRHPGLVHLSLHNARLSPTNVARLKDHPTLEAQVHLD
jgi:hypothetical protein